MLCFFFSFRNESTNNSNITKTETAGGQSSPSSEQEKDDIVSDSRSADNSGVEDMEVEKDDDSSSQKQLYANTALSAEEARALKILTEMEALVKTEASTKSEKANTDTVPSALEQFNNFNYWRTPLPEVDLMLVSNSSHGHDTTNSVSDSDDYDEEADSSPDGTGQDLDTLERGGGSTESSQTVDSLTANLVDSLQIDSMGDNAMSESKIDWKSGVVPNSGGSSIGQGCLTSTNSSSSSRAFYVETPNFFTGHIAGTVKH